MINSPSHLQLAADMLCKAINELSRRVEHEAKAGEGMRALATTWQKQRLHEAHREIMEVIQYLKENP